MKIGIFNPYFDDLGGGEKYMMTVAECLSKKHDVTVFWDRKEDVEELLRRFPLDLSRVNFAKNIFSAGTSLLERILATRPYDTIIVLSDGSIPFVLSKKLFLHFQQPLRPMLSIKDRFKLGRVTGIFCNSKYTKSFIDKALGVDSYVIYPPVDFHVKRTKKENMILTVGRLRVKDVTVDGKPLGDYKKQMVMVEVFKQLVKEGLKGWRFVVAVSIREEDKETFDKMKKKTEDFPIEFVVNQNNRQLWEYYSRTKIYWHAAGYGEDLEKHPEYAEHFGISTVEAMGGGAVPVVFNAGGQKEIVQDGENGLLWNSPRELQDKTLWVIRDSPIWQRLSESAKLASKPYSKERFCEELHEILEE